jgi:hypothetical protein
MPRVEVNQLSNSETVSHTEHNAITPITFLSVTSRLFHAEGSRV